MRYPAHLGHDGVDGNEPQTMRWSSELGGAAVREAEEEDGRRSRFGSLAIACVVEADVGGLGVPLHGGRGGRRRGVDGYSELELKLGRSMVGRATAWRG